jgi:hypothetical protein
MIVDRRSAVEDGRRSDYLHLKNSMISEDIDA